LTFGDGELLRAGPVCRASFLDEASNHRDVSGNVIPGNQGPVFFS
jgi:hypothetical protein